MDSERLKLVLVCGLVILLIALIIWTASVVKSRMSTNRTVVIENNRIEGAIAYDEAHATSDKYWYNKYDMDSEDEIDRLKAKHYFNDIKECIDDLIIEMYDCGFVHTEELYTIAYGKDALTPDAPIFKVYGEDEDEDLELPPLSNEAKEQILSKWEEYVDVLFEEVVIETSQNEISLIKDSLKKYGHKDLAVLLKCPE